jgi:hypothetical protein
MQTIFSMTTENLAALLMGEDYPVWVGCLGYDTRPYSVRTTGREMLPVRATIGYADGRPDRSIQGLNVGDIVSHLKTLNALGVEIVVPEWGGCNLVGETRYTPIEGGMWAEVYIDLRD